MRFILHYYYYTINPSVHNCTKYAMTVVHEASAAREPIGIAEKRQQYFDICE